MHKHWCINIPRMSYSRRNVVKKKYLRYTFKLRTEIFLCFEKVVLSFCISEAHLLQSKVCKSFARSRATYRLFVCRFNRYCIYVVSWQTYWEFHISVFLISSLYDETEIAEERRGLPASTTYSISALSWYQMTLPWFSIIDHTPEKF